MPTGSTWLSLVRASALGWLPLTDRPLPSMDELGVHLQQTSSDGVGQQTNGLKEHPLLAQNERVYINVSGRIFQVYKSLLDRYPETLLGSNEKEYFFDQATGQYFLDRDPGIFLSVID